MRLRLLRTNRALTAIVGEGFLSRLSFGFISFALPLYAFRRGMSLAAIGVLLSFNMIVAILLKPAMAWLADRFGLKQAFTAAIALRSAVPLLLLLSPSPWQLFAIRGLHGLSISLRDPSVNALIAEVGGKKAVASAFAWYQTGKSVAGTFGKALAGILLGLPTGGFGFVFGAAFILSMLPIIALRYVPPHHHHADQTAAERQSIVSTREARGDGRRGGGQIPSPLPYAVLGLLISGTAVMITNLFPILATEYAGLTESQTGFVYVLSIVAILTGPLWGWLSDHVSRELVLAVRGGANMLSSLLYLLVPNLFGMAAGRVTDDVGKAAFRPAWGALMAELALVDRRRRARVMAYLTVGEDIGEALAPVVAGLLWSAWGVAVVLVTRIGLALVTEAYAYLLMVRPPRREPTRKKRGARRLTGPFAAQLRRRTVVAPGVAVVAGAVVLGFVGFTGREPLPPDVPPRAAPATRAVRTYTSPTLAWEITYPARFTHATLPRPSGLRVSFDGIWIANFDSPRFDPETGGPLLEGYPDDGVLVEVYQTFGGPFFFPRRPDSAFPIAFEDFEVVPGAYSGAWRTDTVLANGEPYTFHVRLGPRAKREDREAAREIVSTFRLLPLQQGTITGEHVTFYVLAPAQEYAVGSVTRFDGSNLPSEYGEPFPFYLVRVPEGFYALATVNRARYQDCDVTYDSAVREFFCRNGLRWALDGSVIGRQGERSSTRPLQVALVRVSLDGHILVSPNVFVANTKLDLTVTG